MPEDPNVEPGVWQQLRRRRVMRATILYLAFAFLGVEGAQMVLAYFPGPEWGARAALGVAVLGFPFAVVLAWTYDVTRGGIVRTPDDFQHGDDPTERSSRRGWLLVVAAAVATGLVLRLLRP